MLRLSNITWFYLFFYLKSLQEMISQNGKPALEAYFTCGPREIQSLLADEVTGNQRALGWGELYLGEALIRENTVSPPKKGSHTKRQV